MSEYRNNYLQRDAQLQKHIRTNGSHSDNVKEAPHVDAIRKSQRRVLELQEEKIELAQKALDLIDKHKSRLDAQIANLVREGLMPADALTPAPPPSNLPAASQHVVGGSGGGGGRGAVGIGRASPGLGLARGFNQDRGGTPVTPGLQAGSNKRLKLGHQSTPSISSLAGRPGPATPGIRAESSRAGTPSGHSGTRKTGRKKPPVKRVIDEDGEDDDEDEDDEGGEGEDKKLYCVCQQVSYGSMVGCDDKECPYEWFHWGCVHLTEEPKGKWFCPTCAMKRDRSKMR